MKSWPDHNKTARRRWSGSLILALLICLSTAAGESLPQRPLPADPRPGEEWISPHGIAFCWCPPGKVSITDEAGRREVVFSSGFWMAKYETTCGQARAIDRQVRRRTADAGTTINDSDEPLAGFDFDAFQRVLQILNGTVQKKAEPAKDKPPQKPASPQQAEINFAPGGWEFALPTEAEWEYACRAGASTAYSFGDDAAQLPQFANFADKTLFEAQEGCRYADRKLSDGIAKLAKAGGYKPNAWGLYDMHGNVWEICENFVARGGAWCSIAEYCRADFRHDEHRGEKRLSRPWLGYRLVLRPRAAEKSGTTK